MSTADTMAADHHAACPALGRWLAAWLRAGLTALVSLVLLAWAQPAAAAMYGYMSSPGGLYRVDTVTGTATLIYNGTPFPVSQAPGLALRDDGVLFFTINAGGNQPVYRYDLKTPSTAPASLGTTGSTVPYIHRMAFHPTNGQLYALAQTVSGNTGLYTINQTNGSATLAATITGLTSGSGDIAFHPTTGELYLPFQSNASSATVYRIPLTSGAAVNVGTITGLVAPGATRIFSAMFDDQGRFYIAGDNSPSFPLRYINFPSGTGWSIAATTVANMGVRPEDFASVPIPSPAVSKSFSPSTVSVNQDSTLTITLTNPSSTYAHLNAAFTDTYPSGLVNSPTPAASTTCAGGTVTATAGGNTVSLSGATIPANSSCTVTVTVRSSTAGSYTNTLPAGAVTTLFGYNDSAASATLTVLLAPIFDKQVSPVCDPVNFNVNPKNLPGAYVRYTLTLTNGTGGVVTLNQISDPLGGHVLDPDLRTGTNISCESSPPMSAIGNSVRISCSDTVNDCQFTQGTSGGAGIRYFTGSSADSDGVSYSGTPGVTPGTLTLDFATMGDQSLQNGATMTIQFNAIIP